VRYRFGMGVSIGEARPEPGPLRSAVELQALLLFERDANSFLWWHDELGRQVLLSLRGTGWRVDLGRSLACDVVIGWDPKVSRSHALLERLATGWTIVDDGLSKNGTYVNDRRVRTRERLTDGDRIRLGDSLLCYREPVALDPASTAAGDREAPVALAPMQRRVLIALCRPLSESSNSVPATNREIAAELCLSVEAVKSQLRVLGDRFGVGPLPQNHKRSRIAQMALASGSISVVEF